MSNYNCNIYTYNNLKMLTINDESIEKKSEILVIVVDSTYADCELFMSISMYIDNMKNIIDYKKIVIVTYNEKIVINVVESDIYYTMEKIFDQMNICDTSIIVDCLNEFIDNMNFLEINNYITRFIVFTLEDVNNELKKILAMSEKIKIYHYNYSDSKKVADGNIINISYEPYKFIYTIIQNDIYNFGECEILIKGQIYGIANSIIKKNKKQYKMYFTSDTDIIKINNCEVVCKNIKNLDTTELIDYYMSGIEFITTIDVNQDNYDKLRTMLNIIDKLKKDICNYGDMTNEKRSKIKCGTYMCQTVLGHMIDITITSEKNELGNNLNKMLINNKKTKNMKNIYKFYNRIINNKKGNIQIINNIDQEFFDTYDNLIDDSSNTPFDESCETFKSLMTMSSWYDELKDSSCMGMLIKLNTDSNVKFGYWRCNPKITEITTTCMPITDYIDTVITYFDNNNIDTYDLNDQDIITGTGVGTANAVIPLYIHKSHWSIAKQYLPYVLGIILTNNPFGYTDSHINYIYYLLSDMSMKTLTTLNLSTKWIKVYIALMRTCSEISYEKKYNIKKLVTNYLKKNDQTVNTGILLGQLLSSACIVSKAIGEDKIKQLCENMYTAFIKHYFNKNYNRTKYKMSDENSRGKYIGKMVFNFNKNQRIQNEIRIVISFYKMYKIIKDVIEKCSGYIKFLELLENNYGNIPDNICDDIIKKIKQTFYSYNDLLDAMGKTGDINEIIEMHIKKYIEEDNEKTSKKIDL